MRQDKQQECHLTASLFFNHSLIISSCLACEIGTNYRGIAWAVWRKKGKKNKICCRVLKSLKTRKTGHFTSLIGSLRSTTRLQRQGDKICILSWQKQKFCTPFTCFFFNSVHFFQVLGKSATWNDHFSSFTENVNTQAQIWIFFSSVDAALNSVPR